MSRLLCPRLRAALATATVAVGIAMSASAEVVSGVEKNWTVVPSMLPHIVLNRNSSVDFAVDKYGPNGWLVCVHHTNGWGYVEKGVVGSTVNDATFLSDLYKVEGTGDVFRVAFCWWQRSGSASTSKFYGWFTLGTTSDGEMTVLASEVADEPDVALVGRGEPDSIKDDSGGDSSDGGDTSESGDSTDGGDTSDGGDSPDGGDASDSCNESEEDLVFDWVVIDCGDYLELGLQGNPSGTSGKVTIPSEIGGKPVCSIGYKAFSSHDEITQVVIPETVSNIGYYAFGDCSSLERCNVPSGVTNIDEMAFQNTALGEIALPDGVLEIKNGTFLQCASLSNAVWGAGVTNIGEMAFCLTALTNVTIGSRIESIDFGAFQGCKMKSVRVWPWTRLGVQAFDSSCIVWHMGTVTNFSGYAAEDWQAATNLMTLVGREHFDGVTEFRVYDDYGSLAGNEYGTSKLLYYMGIAPGCVSRTGSEVRAKYTLPEIEVVSFDLASRTLTGRVVPKGGCRIASKPEIPDRLCVRRFDSLNDTGSVDWSAAPDVSSYDSPDAPGVFTHTISEEDLATNRFFRLEISD